MITALLVRLLFHQRHVHYVCYFYVRKLVKVILYKISKDFFRLSLSSVYCSGGSAVRAMDMRLKGPRFNAQPILIAGHLQATLSKLLTYCVLRPTQPLTIRGTGIE